MTIPDFHAASGAFRVTFSDAQLVEARTNATWSAHASAVHEREAVRLALSAARREPQAVGLYQRLLAGRPPALSEILVAVAPA
jgi:hypothetical protein